MNAGRATVLVVVVVVFIFVLIKLDCVLNHNLKKKLADIHPYLPHAYLIPKLLQLSFSLPTGSVRVS